jgi:hypothetical protein
MRTTAILALVAAASAETMYAQSSSAAAPKSGDFTLLGDLVPSHASVGWGSYQVNKNWYKKPFTIKGQTYKFGVFAHAPSDIRYHIEGKYKSFTGCVGLDDMNAYGKAVGSKCGDGAMFKVFLDKYRTNNNAVVWEQAWSAQKFVGDAATCFTINLEVRSALRANKGLISEKNAQQLRLVVDEDTNNKCDHADWVNTKLWEDPVVDCQQLGSLVPSFKSVGWGSYWVNRNWYQNGFVIAGARYSSGVFAHAPSKLMYPLHKRYDSFSACVGIDDGDGHCGNGADFQIWLTNANGKEALYKTITKKSNEAATCFSIDTKARQSLTLIVDPKGDTSCDEAEWVNANVCREAPKPQDCVVGTWEGFGVCSKSCGTGFHVRKRSIVKREKFGGKGCPTLTATQSCNSGPCPIDCIMTNWAQWGACAATCGRGNTQTRHRSVARAAVYGGKRCPLLTQRRGCGNVPCPSNCQTTAYGAWTSCSKSCGSGKQSKHRRITKSHAFGGIKCPKLSEARNCATVKCTVDCVVSAWEKWGACSKTCGTGYKTRKRLILRMSAHGGASCPKLTARVACNAHSCPIDCVLTQWGKFPACSRTCAGGQQTRYRSIKVQSAFGGKACGTLMHTQACAKFACPKDCITSVFTSWGHCSKTCGGGSMYRKRHVTHKAQFGGKVCPHTRENRKCNLHSCPIHCQIGAWSKFSKCGKTCGGGQRKQTRKVVEGQFGGRKCNPNTVSFLKSSCNTQACPTDCKVSAWSFWSRCPKTCRPFNMPVASFTGVHTRTRVVLTKGKITGKSCPSLKESKKCAHNVICPIDAVQSVWSAPTKCTKSCDGGEQTFTRQCTAQPKFGGKKCGKNSKTTPCNTQECPTDCVTGPWKVSGSCSKSCGTGKLLRTREIKVHAQFGGKPCIVKEFKVCTHKTKCPIHCKVGPWTLEWSKCTKGCVDGPLSSAGIQEKIRAEVQAAKYGGRACPSIRRTKACNQHRCPVHCKVGTWKSAWTKCTRSCGTGFSRLHRDIKNYGSFGGKNNCKGFKEISCNTKACPTDCRMGAWGAWGKCTKSCNQGSSTRVRKVAVNALNGGKACGSKFDVRFCNLQSCALKTGLKDVLGNTWKTYAPSPSATLAPVKFSSKMTFKESKNGAAQARTKGLIKSIMVARVKAKSVKVYKKCFNGPNRVDGGWHGAGWGNDYCNLCKCDAATGKLSCQKKNCGESAKGKICSHTKCRFIYNFEAKHTIMMVTSHHAELKGESHHCAYNLRSKSCQCRCFGTRSAAKQAIWTQKAKQSPVTPLHDSSRPKCLDSQRRMPGIRLELCVDKDSKKAAW